MRATVKAPSHHPAGAAQGIQLSEHLLLEAGVLGGRIHLDAGVEPRGENHSVGESCPEPRGDREAVVGVEAVLVVAAKRQSWGPSVEMDPSGPAPKALDRGGKVGGTSPPRSVGQIEAPRYPTRHHFATRSWPGMGHDPSD